VFLGNVTNDFDVASTILYQLGYRETSVYLLTFLAMVVPHLCNVFLHFGGAQF